MDQQIKTEFTQNGFALEDEEDTLQKCLTFCINFGLKPSELVSSWEVYYLNMQLDGCKVLSSHLDGFRQHLQNEQKQSLQKQDTDLHFYSSNDIDMLLENGHESNDDDTQNTPVKQSIRSTGHGTPDLFSPFALAKTPGTDGKSSGKYRSRVRSSSPVTPFGNRSNKYVVQFVFNKDISDGSTEDKAAEPQSEDDVIRRMPPVQRYSLQMLGSWPTPRCRYMYDSIEEKFESLERRIKMFASALAAKEAHNFSSNVALASQESVFVVGLVCCDGEGHLNDKSIMLEGSVEFSGGQTVRLDLHKLDGFSFFPGQVIGVEGNNPSGHCLVASRLFDSFPTSYPLHLGDSDAPSAKRLAVDRNSTITSLPRTQKSISMLIAAGPFTTTDNLDFEPLIDLLAYARKKQPNLLLLMGPFIDSDHPQIKIGTVDRLFSQIFQEEVGARLQEYCEEMGPGARVVLVPSTRDAHHDSVFPQPPFNIDAYEDSNQQITCIANPGIFSFNEITIGCCTVDILRHLSSEEISRIPEGSSNDRLARLATHVLKQRSFYPLFPAVSGLNLDLSVAPEALHMLSIPDLLILPSDLASFVKVLHLADAIQKTELGPSQNGSHEDFTHRQYVCVNPGRLAKGINGGTFAELFSQGKNTDSTVADATDCITDRTKISIVRI
ncbi:uncharacterized protein LOC131055078 [Cryptomeria japonica]|uniref:uncharacterized protein LOC131055078 n=1 Tax=Cryptomeria japonica TaxID=3369 RepID=UPI0027D9E8BC|nr:uncharacterized protein LOC131055078 [Cryptomeria japonica]